MTDSKNAGTSKNAVSPSKNAISIDQLEIACRHTKEMMAAGATENLAIRTLELFADVYGKLHQGGSATPHHVKQVQLWSIRAQSIQRLQPDAVPKDWLRVEHGTPRRGFARRILSLYDKGALTQEAVDALVERYYRLAVITLDEDRELNRVARSKVFDTPEQRWAAAGIEF